MKRFAALAAMLLLLCVGGFALAEEAGTAPDEWTVLFYFCGSDLESRYGYASDDLKEISDVMFPYDYSVWENFGAMRDIGKINVLIETGGSRAWHTKEKDVGIDVSADLGKLQSDKIIHDQLCRVGLGRRHGNLRSGQCITYMIRLSRDG